MTFRLFIFLFIILIIFIIFSSLTFLKSNNNNFKFINYSVEDGLANNEVNAICQDKNGFIWIGTADGLNKFDGYTFTSYFRNIEDSLTLSNNLIKALLIDYDDNLIGSGAPNDKLQLEVVINDIKKYYSHVDKPEIERPELVTLDIPPKDIFICRLTDDGPKVIIRGESDQKYIVEFIDSDLSYLHCAQTITPGHWALCNDIEKPVNWRINVKIYGTGIVHTEDFHTGKIIKKHEVFESDLFSHFSEYENIVVIGPQRSGTTIAAKMIANDTGKRFVDEVEVSPIKKDIDKLFHNNTNFVLQGAVLFPNCHKTFYDKENTAIVVMKRDITDITTSQNKIWNRGGEEERERSYYPGSDPNLPISQIKYDFWYKHQKHLLSNTFEIEYESLSTHPLWVPKEKRSYGARWHGKQTQLT